MTRGGYRVLDTLRRLALLQASKLALQTTLPGSSTDAKHIGRLFALLADPDVRAFLLDGAA